VEGFLSDKAGKRMSHADKVEVMDFLINVLKDHEKNLDILISRAENLLDENQPQKLMQNPPSLKISLKDWDEFRDRALDSELICFDLINSTFYCSAITENKIYRYSEQAPEITLELKENKENLVLSGIRMEKLEDQFSLLNGQLSIGLELKANKVKNLGDKHVVQYELDVLYTKNWLSRELGIHRDFIVQGDIDP
jgi:hypothetical protein